MTQTQEEFTKTVYETIKDKVFFDGLNLFDGIEGIEDDIQQMTSYTKDGCTGLTSVIIPEGIEEIYDCAFKGCTSLTSITLPKSIKQVSFDAFDGCRAKMSFFRICRIEDILARSHSSHETK